jgi:excisionase family DNA binding protein
MNEWMTEEEAAEWLGVPLKDLNEAVSRAELPVLRIGNLVRLSRTALVTQASGRAAKDTAPTVLLPVARAVAQVQVKDGRVAAPAVLHWRTSLTPAAAFEHHWPQRGGGSYVEQYPRAWSGTITLAGTAMTVLVGEATGAERKDKARRLTVLLDRYPMAEFAPTSDGTGWASLIKPDGRHTVAAADPLPRLYHSARVEPYHQVTGLGGRGRPSGAAVVIASDDIQSAVHHAAARWLARNGRPAEPAA